MAPIILQLNNFNEQLGSLEQTISHAVNSKSPSGTNELTINPTTLDALIGSRPDFSPIQQTLVEIAEQLHLSRSKRNQQLPHHMRNPIPKEMRDDPETED